MSENKEGTTNIEKEKKQPERTIRSKVPSDLSLASDIQRLENRVEEIRTEMRNIRDDVMVSVSIFMGLLAVVFSVVIAFVTDWKIGEEGAGVIIFELAFISSFIVYWYLKWSKLRRKKIDEIGK